MDQEANDDDDDDDEGCVSPKSEAPDSPKVTSDESVMSAKDTAAADRDPGVGVAAGGAPAATPPAATAANELHIYPWMRRVHSGHGRKKS